MFLAYNFFLTLLSPFWVPWMLWRTWQRKEPVNWAERQGIYDLPARSDRNRLWFHAVSVGEVMAALPILRVIRKVLPEYEIVLSVTTSSGHKTATDKAVGLFDYLVYFPIDVPRFQLRAMQRVRPDVVCIMETELWMNFLWAAKTFSAQTLLINGRVSDRSFPRSQKLTLFYRALLKDVNRCLMQSEVDAERIRALGATQAEVFGNCKFDQAIEGLNADPAHWKKEFQVKPDRSVVLVGSIRSEEFRFLSETISKLPAIQWIIAPRHLEKTPELVNALTEAGSKDIGIRSKSEVGPITIVDTYGELAELYSIADVAVVGGGFANLGGQNILQPLAQGKPVLFGPHMQNFRDVAAMAVASGASVICTTPVELADQIQRICSDSKVRIQMGKAAKSLVRSNVGASARYGAAIKAAAEKATIGTRSRPKSRGN